MKKSTLIKLLGLIMCVCMLASFVAGCSGDTNKDGGDQGTATAAPTDAPKASAAAATDAPKASAAAATNAPAAATPIPEYTLFEDVYIEDEHNIADKNGEIWSTSNRTATMSSSDYTDALKALGSTYNKDGTFDLPIVDDGSKLTIWLTLGEDKSGSITNHEEIDVVQYIQEITGIDLVYIHPTYGQESTEFPIMVASGDWPDISRDGFNANKGEEYLDDGIWYDMQYMIRDWMPNYRWRVRELGVERDANSDSGRIWCIFYLEDPQELPWQGLNIRRDMMWAAGITEYPVTLADYEPFMDQMLAYWGKDQGCITPGIYGLAANYEFMSAWDIGWDFYVDPSGIVKFGAVEDAFKEYLLKMNEWYDKGYIHSDFAAGGFNIRNGDEHDIAVLTIAFGAVRGAIYSRGWGDFPDLWWEPVVAPVMNEGDVQHFRRLSSNLYNRSVVYGDTEDPVLCAKYIDWLCTDNGTIIAGYGEYGKHWVYGSDGLPDGTDYTQNPPEGLDRYVWKARINIGWQYIGTLQNDWWVLVSAYSWTRYSSDISWYYAGEVWGQAAGDYVYPYFATLTAEESSEYSTLFTDIQTYIREMTPQFISGLVDIESGWDTFVQTIETMGYERCVEMKQDAYDRYWAR